MANTVQDFADPRIGLSVTPAGTANFNIPGLITDDDAVPFDQVLRSFTASTYSSSFTSGSDESNWMAALWAQDTGGPDKAYVIRWAKAASAAYCVCPDAVTTISTWTGLAATGQLKIREGASDEDINPDFTSVTSMADVAAAIQTALQAGILTASYTCTLDDLSRITITSDNTGASADAVSIDTPAAGTDLSLPAYLGASFSQAGFDAEAPETAMNRALARNSEPFAFDLIGGSIAQYVSLSTAIAALSKVAFFTVRDTDAYDSGATTDVGYLIEALGHNQTRILFTRQTSQWPSAADMGQTLAKLEGSANHALTQLTNISLPGLAADGTTIIAMTDDQETALKAKGYDWPVKPINVTHFVHGLAAGGNEMRVMVGKMFIEYQIAVAWYGYLIASDVVTFSDGDIINLGELVRYWLDIAVERKLLDADYTLNLPSASDFTAAVKATHIMDLPNISDADVQIAVNKITGTLNWAV